MSSKKSDHPIFDYFKYNENTGKSSCEIEGCSFPLMAGKHTSNLIRHIQYRHKEVYTDYLNKYEKWTSDKKNSKRKHNDAFVNVKISRNDFISGCLQMVTLNARSFCALQDSGFKLIVAPILYEFERIQQPVSLHSLHFENLAMKIKTYIKDKISSEMKGKLLSFQLDLTNHLQREILGINVQYYVGNQLVLRVLGVRIFWNATSGLSLAKEIQKILGEYGADIDQIYTMTTDNGRNVNLCSKILQVLQENELEAYLLENADDFEKEELEGLIELETERIERGQVMQFLHIIHCSSHTLQLAIGDVLGAEPYKHIINGAREVVKKLRTPNIVALLKSKGSKLAIIDGDTRWSSVHDMVH